MWRLYSIQNHIWTQQQDKIYLHKHLASHQESSSSSPSSSNEWDNEIVVNSTLMMMFIEIETLMETYCFLIYKFSDESACACMGERKAKGTATVAETICY